MHNTAVQYDECTACFAIKNKTPTQVKVAGAHTPLLSPPVLLCPLHAAIQLQSVLFLQEYLESKFGPAAAEGSGDVKGNTSEELWGAQIWDHDHPTGGLTSTTSG